MTTDSQQFTADELEQIRSETFVAGIEHHRELASTNDRALELSRQEDLPTPFLILAERQTEGRGRGDNRWWSDAGGLTFSLVVDSAATDLPLERRPLLSLTAGLAVCEILEHLLPDQEIGLKWPNDVYLERRKVCGILAEVPPGQGRRVVVGIGLNVNNSLDAAPEEVRDAATSLHDATGRTRRLSDVLVVLLARLAERLATLGTSDEELPRHWQKRCLLQGLTVQVAAGDRQQIGICRGIDHDGALLLETGTGLERCFGGVVTRFE